ncbi:MULTISPECIES: hypothetical protein [Aerosakkonema]|uniref:hypothetical protein n=1 Tax=Aerosakkonema TaxID=1246629 RepID=UPI0035B78C81
MKPGKIEILKLGAIAMLLGGVFATLIGFFWTPNVPVTKIKDLEKQRDKKSTVYIRGRVVKQVPFLGTRAYEVEDSTGTVYVITKDKFPAQNREIIVEGKVQYKSIPLAGQELGEIYIKEQQRL